MSTIKILPPSLSPERVKVDDYCAARSGLIPPLPWPTFSPPFSPMPEVRENTVSRALEGARRKLLDTGTRNRLVHVNRTNARSNCLNIINERADDIFSILRGSGRRMRFKAMGRDKAEEGQAMLLALPEPIG